MKRMEKKENIVKKKNNITKSKESKTSPEKMKKHNIDKSNRMAESGWKE